MNALILNGALPGDRDLDRVQDILARELRARGYRIRSLSLRDTSIAYCRGCFECWVKTPGICKTRDRGRDIARAWITSDLLVFLTPVTFGGYSSELKKALDRVISLVAPFFTRINGEVHHESRYERYPSLLVIGTACMSCAEEEAVFHELVRRNAVNMHAPAYASRVMRAVDQALTRDMLKEAVAAVGSVP